MIGNVEVSVASSLEVDDLKFANEKLTCKPVFYSKKDKGLTANMLVIKTFDTNGALLKTKLIRVSSEGNIVSQDRTNRYVHTESES